eukprot:CAMPEP_0114978944 /NCGR_PEP_ID=MMETSP0216-20121206/4092_1 /TAXON_ID=223996 /ORGANISM="Protocruzia adherens, Strain Boccale" /LENGTH=832 /DNA_ID=CAMNT_0002340205 /DNA_START=760 /DNA_END=3259 /DNA_ORIENTATION=+
MANLLDLSPKLKNLRCLSLSIAAERRDKALQPEDLWGRLKEKLPLLKNLQRVDCFFRPNLPFKANEEKQYLKTLFEIGKELAEKYGIAHYMGIPFGKIITEEKLSELEVDVPLVSYWIFSKLLVYIIENHLDQSTLKFLKVSFRRETLTEGDELDEERGFCLNFSLFQRKRCGKSVIDLRAPERLHNCLSDHFGAGNHDIRHISFSDTLLEEAQGLGMRNEFWVDYPNLEKLDIRDFVEPDQVGMLFLGRDDRKPLLLNESIKELTLENCSLNKFEPTDNKGLRSFRGNTLSLKECKFDVSDFAIIESMSSSVEDLRLEGCKIKAKEPQEIIDAVISLMTTLETRTTLRSVIFDTLNTFKSTLSISEETAAKYLDLTDRIIAKNPALKNLSIIIPLPLTNLQKLASRAHQHLLTSHRLHQFYGLSPPPKTLLSTTSNPPLPHQQILHTHLFANSHQHDNTLQIPHQMLQLANLSEITQLTLYQSDPKPDSKRLLHEVVVLAPVLPMLTVVTDLVNLLENLGKLRVLRLNGLFLGGFTGGFPVKLSATVEEIIFEPYYFKIVKGEGTVIPFDFRQCSGVKKVTFATKVIWGKNLQDLVQAMTEVEFRFEHLECGHNEGDFDSLGQWLRCGKIGKMTLSTKFSRVPEDFLQIVKEKTLNEELIVKGFDYKACLESIRTTKHLEVVLDNPLAQVLLIDVLKEEEERKQLKSITLTKVAGLVDDYSKFPVPEGLESVKLIQEGGLSWRSSSAEIYKKIHEFTLVLGAGDSITDELSIICDQMDNLEAFSFQCDSDKTSQRLLQSIKKAQRDSEPDWLENPLIMSEIENLRARYGQD